MLGEWSESFFGLIFNGFLTFEFLCGKNSKISLTSFNVTQKKRSFGFHLKKNQFQS